MTVTSQHPHAVSAGASLIHRSAGIPVESAVPRPLTDGVHSRRDPSDELPALAAAQSGVIGAEQLVSLSCPAHPRHRPLGGATSLASTAPGVYLVGAGDPSWRARAWAGVLLGGPRLGSGSRRPAIPLGSGRRAPVRGRAGAAQEVRHRRPGGWVFRRETRRRPRWSESRDRLRAPPSRTLWSTCPTLEPADRGARPGDQSGARQTHERPPDLGVRRPAAACPPSSLTCTTCWTT